MTLHDNFCPRDGFNELFDQLHKYNVPMFIFSAGVGDILEEIIRQANVFYPNVNVVSNYMDFDDSVSVQGAHGGRVVVLVLWAAEPLQYISAGVWGVHSVGPGRILRAESSSSPASALCPVSTSPFRLTFGSQKWVLSVEVWCWSMPSPGVGVELTEA